MRKYLIIILTAFAVSCAKEGRDIAGEPECRVNAIVNGFFSPGQGESTRSSIAIEDGKFVFKWSEGDCFGIFPNTGQHQQLRVKVSVSDIGETAFNSSLVGWNLNTNPSLKIRYAAYRPFVADYSKSPENISCNYCGQTQEGNGKTDINLAHLGAFDYLATDPIWIGNGIKASGSDTEATFKFNHISSLVRLRILAEADGEYSKMELSTTDGSRIFPQSSFLSLFKEPQIVAKKDELSDSFAVGLKNFSVQKYGYMNIWMLTPPFSTEGKTLSIKLTGTNGTPDFTCEIPGRALKAGERYSLNAPDYAIIYKAGEGVFSGERKEIIEKAFDQEGSHTFDLTEDIPQLENYELIGWTDELGSTEVKYSPDGTLTLLSDKPVTILYAVYSHVISGIIINAGSAEQGVDNYDFTEDDQIWK